MKEIDSRFLEVDTTSSLLIDRITKLESAKNKNTNSVNCFGYAFDNSVEAFHHQKLKILGIMWHPERYKKYNDFDFELLRKFYAFNNLSSW